LLPFDGAVDRVGQFAPFAAHGVKALAQGGAGGHSTQAQGLVGKALLAKGFDGFEVVLAQGEHGDVALEDVAVGNTRAQWILGIDHGRQVDALEQAPHQGQATVAAQVVGQLLDNELDWVSHLRRLHLLGAWLLVGTGGLGVLGGKSRIQPPSKLRLKQLHSPQAVLHRFITD
jgi:hypothetical protein